MSGTLEKEKTLPNDPAMELQPDEELLFPEFCSRSSAYPEAKSFGFVDGFIDDLITVVQYSNYNETLGVSMLNKFECTDIPNDRIRG
jgi:hypothetical protein